MQLLGDKFSKHCFQVGFHKEIVIEGLDCRLLAFLFLLIAVLEVLLRLLSSQIGCQVTVVIGPNIVVKVDGEEGSACEDLRSCTLKVVVDQFHLIHFTLQEHRARLDGDVATLSGIGFVSQMDKRSCRS